MIFLGRRIRLRRYDGGFVLCSVVGDVGRLLARVLVGILNASRHLSDKQDVPMLQTDFLAAVCIDSNEMFV